MSEGDHSGFLNLDKPLHLTSHDVVARVRRRYRSLTGSKKVGHAGTLDPLASGVLVLCLGKSTRLSDFVMRGTKVYRGQVRLGIETTTYDAGGPEVGSGQSTDHITLDLVARQLKQFIGEVQQIPPMYSAIKVKGQKLYELARQGKSIQREPRLVNIHSIDILAWDNPRLELEIHCSAGTYIRSLAHDLGQALGTGAHLSALQRIASGRFKIDSSISLEWVLSDDDFLQEIVPPRAALADEISIVLSAADIQQIGHGRAISRQQDLDAEYIFAFAADNRLVAILKPQGDIWKPHKVFWDQS